MSDNIPIQENRKFKMHNNLLHTIIFKQSGSIEKAILELLMNSIDANSTRIDINYDSTKDTFTIADDGKGFTTDEEIEAFFDTLGTPHKDGDAKFGRFRIGRTQIFAYASTVWRSGTYRMTVDFLNDNENELGYKLEKNLPFQKGCIITGNRYSAEQLNTNFLESLSSVIRTVLNEYFPYSDIPIYVNSELKVIANNECKWDLETNNAYYKFNNYRGANIYNMGAFVKSYDGSYFGIGVDIVSKKALDINFARNDIILYNCKVFQDISEEIKNYVNRIALKKNRLNEEEKKYIYTQFMNGELEYHQVRNIKMFTDVFGKDFSFEEFVKAKRVTFSDGKSGKLAEKVHESKTALVFNSNFSYLFGNNDFREFINAIWDKMDLVLSSIDKKHPSYNIIKNDLHSLNRQRCTTNIKDFESSFSTNHEIFETSQLSKKEQILLKSVRRLNDIFYKEYSVLLRCKKRKIVFGDSLVSDAWTDGASYIAINKKFTPISEQGTKFFSHILLLIVHEYCHNDFTTNEHPHNQEFYKLYHDITLNGGFKELENDLEMESISNLPKRASLTYYNELENNDIKAPKKLKQEMSHTQEYKDNKVVESFISHFGDYYWKKTNRTFEDFIQELFLSPKNDFNVIEKYILTKNKITQALLNSDSFDSRDLFIKIDDISRFVDFTIANLVKLFKTTTIVMILKNINSLIEAYNNRDRDYSIETAIKKELKEDINYRKASTFVYMYKTDIFYGRMDRNLHICVITDEIYDRVKKEYEELYPDLFKKLTINKNLKEKLSIIKKDIEDYNNNKDAKYDEFIKIKNFANEVVPCMSIIMPLKEYLSFEKLGYNPCLRQTHRLYFYEYEPIETSIVGNKLVQIV